MRATHRSYTSPSFTRSLSPISRSLPRSLSAYFALNYCIPRFLHHGRLHWIWNGGENKNKNEGRGSIGAGLFFATPHVHFASEHSQSLAFRTQPYSDLSRFVNALLAEVDSNGNHRNSSIATATTNKRDNSSSMHVAHTDPELHVVQRMITYLQQA